MSSEEEVPSPKACSTAGIRDALGYPGQREPMAGADVARPPE